MVARIEFESFVCAEALYLRAAASASSAPVALAAASASSASPVLSAMFGSRLFDQRVLGLVAQGLGLSRSRQARPAVSRQGEHC